MKEEQLGRKFTPQERLELLKRAMGDKGYELAMNDLAPFGGGLSEYYEIYQIPRYIKEPYTLRIINTEK